MATAAGTTASARQKQQAALFKAKHEELLSEARGVAFEFGANVRAIVIRPGPGGGGVAHDFVGAERVADAIARAVAMDVSAMGMEQVVEHQRKLRQLRAIVARELQARAEAKAKDDAAAAAAAAGASKRALEQQEMMHESESTSEPSSTALHVPSSDGATAFFRFELGKNKEAVTSSLAAALTNRIDPLWPLRSPGLPVPLPSYRRRPPPPAAAKRRLCLASKEFAVLLFLLSRHWAGAEWRGSGRGAFARRWKVSVVRCRDFLGRSRSVVHWCLPVWLITKYNLRD